MSRADILFMYNKVGRPKEKQMKLYNKSVGGEMFPRSRRSSLGDDGRKGDDTQQETRVGL